MKKNIKVRELISDIGLIPKVVLPRPHVTQFSEDVTRAMRGQPKRLSRNYPRQKLAKSHFTCFDFKRRFIALISLFCTLSRISVRLGFCFLCARLAVNL